MRTSIYLCIAAVVGISLVGGASLAEANAPRVTPRAAEYFTEITLHRHFSDWNSRESGEIRCGDLLSGGKRRCFVEWKNDGIEYGGRTLIWFRRESAGLAWFYAYRIKRVNRACINNGDRHCVKFFIVH